LTTGQLTIAKDLTITGRGQDNTILDGNAGHRPFFLSGHAVVISGMTIRNGYAAADCDFSNPYQVFCGGGIFVDDADLTLSDSTVSGNSAGDSVGKADGGGIFNRGGNLTLNYSDVSGNAAHEGWGDPAEEPYPGDGGGILNSGGTVTLNHSTVTGNSASGYGGGIFSSNGTVTLNHSTVSGNHGSSLGGGIYHAHGALASIGSTIRDNQAGHGGGVFSEGDATLTDSIVSGNSAYKGGGIYSSGSVLSVTTSTVSGNSVDAAGGGIHSRYGTLIVTNSTVAGNVARFGEGGGIYSLVSGTFTLGHSTVSGNSALYFGGGISTRDGTATLSHSTVSGNSADEGGGIYGYGTALTLSNSIVGEQISGDDCWGHITSLGHNLDSDGTCDLTQPTDLPGTEPLLGPLAENGGPTRTHALREGSPAIDAGSCPGALADQRGFPCPVDVSEVPNADDGCDIGAYEFQPPVVCQPDPESQGYWHRQCLGVPAGEGGIDPGRNGRGPSAPTEPLFVEALMPCADDRQEDLGLYGTWTCDGMEADPANNPCEKAEKQLTALILNVCSDRLQETCEVDLSAQGCLSTDLGGLLVEVAGYIQAASCQEAMDCAAAVNEGIGLVNGGKIRKGHIDRRPGTAASDYFAGREDHGRPRRPGVGDERAGAVRERRGVAEPR
jgi:hypothetical protein